MRRVCEASLRVALPSVWTRQWALAPKRHSSPLLPSHSPRGSASPPDQLGVTRTDFIDALANRRAGTAASGRSDYARHPSRVQLDNGDAVDSHAACRVPHGCTAWCEAR
jgi:hypothetical protein